MRDLAENGFKYFEGRDHHKKTDDTVDKKRLDDKIECRGRNHGIEQEGAHDLDEPHINTGGDQPAARAGTTALEINAMRKTS